MTSHIIRRLLIGAVTLVFAITLIFFATRLMAGDPAIATLGDHASRAAIERLRERWGLHDPLHVQYFRFMRRLFTRGDLGVSYRTDDPVADMLLSNLPYTLTLSATFIIGGLLIGIPFGTITALNANNPVDYIGRVVALAGISLPPFYIGILFLWFFSLRLGWFPAMGAGSFGDISNFLYRLILPGLTGALYYAAYVTRYLRSSLLQVLSKNYIDTARAKGLKEGWVIYKHAFRNALIPLITVMGMYVAILIGGSVLIEIVFSRPGIGRLLKGSIDGRDYMVIQGIMIMFAGAVILVNLLVDIAYGIIDPRIRYD